ncbi:hypothetical protein CTAYLR_001028 [Chrysophaeum taylorii]|uniref:Guanine nucleotide-binding protein subunit beta-like protein n=1 Tax=Chrysophaeum taylorii TaxID=2483200 RepID=A0AAD7XQ84_9STRA|nr:hypothetical protein CTAYLR_001028 [Chrysophaeum taylorii]
MAAAYYQVNAPIFGLVHVLRPDGRCVVAYIGGGGSSKTGVGNRVEIAETGTEGLKALATYDTGQELGASLAVSRDGKLLVACFGPKLRAFSTDCLRGEPPTLSVRGSDVAADFHPKEPSLNCCRVAPGDALVATGGDDGKLRLWNAATLTKAQECEAHGGPITDVDFASSGVLACSASKDGTCCVWSVATGAKVACLDAAKANPRVVVPTARLMCRGCKFDGDAKLYSVCSSTRGPAYLSTWTLAPPAKGVALLEATNDFAHKVSKYPVSSMTAARGVIALGDVDGTVSLVSAKSGGRKLVAKKHHDLPVTALAWREGGQDDPRFAILSASADYKIAALAVPTTEGSGGLFFTVLVPILMTLLAVLLAFLFKEE